MLSMTKQTKPLRTVGIAFAGIAAIGLSTLLALNLSMMIWHRFGFEAFFAFIMAYCLVTLVVIIRL